MSNYKLIEKIKGKQDSIAKANEIYTGNTSSDVYVNCSNEDLSSTLNYQNFSNREIPIMPSPTAPFNNVYTNPR
jgi:hypothetical protein